MKLLVFADTHQTTRQLLQMAADHKDAAACFHLGDGTHDAKALEAFFAPETIYTVQGNCDYSGGAPETQLVRLGGQAFYLTHGHHEGVKVGLETLWQSAKSAGATAALFGHTHSPLFEMQGGVYLFNPGSLVQPRGGSKPGYGVITLTPGENPRFEILHPY